MQRTMEQKNSGDMRPYSVLVTGATGFIGGRLICAFEKNGIKIMAMSRKNVPDKENVKFVRADAFDTEQLIGALDGIETAFYLLHSMEGSKDKWEDFAAREKEQAQNFLKAATATGVKRIIYLGGLVSGCPDLSRHMQSRKNVGEILASGSIPVTELRASIIIGAEGGSYAMLRYLVERLSVMVCPKWVKSLAQPIAVDDVVEYLMGCVTHPETTGRIFEIGGADKMTYEEIMRLYASYLNRNLFVIQIPFLTTKLSSYWVDLITPVKASLARPLIDSLVHDTVVNDESIKKIIPLELKSVREAIDIATKETAKKIPVQKHVEEKTGFKVNQQILMISLFAYAVCGTTYYWLGGRAELLEPAWMTVAIFWYAAIGLSILFVHNKTRLGYFIAGILSWATMAFWLSDNLHIAFQTSVILEEPGAAETVRNFVGIAVAAVAATAAHNAFHKVRKYQEKGTPLPV